MSLSIIGQFGVKLIKRVRLNGSSRQIGKQLNGGDWGMNYLSIKSWMAIAGLVVCAAFGMSAQAATRVDFGIGLGGGYAPYYPAPVYAAPYYAAPVCEGHYETRVERILVASEGRERRYIQPVYETRYYNGVPQSFCVNQGGWTEVYVPARYENRSVQVWVPGCASYYVAPRYVTPSFGLDLNFRSRH
jgi:hypothetical protein